jgi:hypothetical protein
VKASGRGLILALLGLQLVRGLLYAFLVPLWQNPDEIGHFEYARLIADHPRTHLDLPLGGTVAYRVLRQLGHEDQPFGTGTSHAELRRAITASLERHRFWEIRPHLNPDETFVNTELRQPPLAYLGGGMILRTLGPGSIERDLYALRILDVLLSVVVVALAGGLGRELFPGRPLLALAPAAFVTFLPQYSALAGSVTNDRPVEIAATGIAWLLVRTARRPSRLRDWMLAAGLVLVGLLAKLTALFLVPALLTVWDWRRARRAGAGRWWYLATRLGAAVVLVWAFARARHWLPEVGRAVETAIGVLPRGVGRLVQGLGVGVHEVLAGSLSQQVLYRLDYFPPTPTFVRRYFAVLFSGFWGNFGHMEAPLPVPLYGALALVSGAALVGLGRCALEARRGRGLAAWQAEALLAMCVLAAWSFTVTFFRDGLVQSYSQGRHLFPVLAPVAVLFVVGLRWLVPRLDDRQFVTALVLWLGLVDVLSLVLAVLPHFYGVSLLGAL